MGGVDDEFKRMEVIDSFRKGKLDMCEWDKCERWRDL